MAVFQLCTGRRELARHLHSSGRALPTHPLARHDMSILGAMFTAVSGLNAQSRSLGNISDNIANSQTVGYKKVDTRFSDIITISNRSLNLPGGVVASPYYANALQGNINQTQSTTNLAVSGQGFFVVSRPTQQTGTLTTFSALPYYTRAGDFEVN